MLGARVAVRGDRQSVVRLCAYVIMESDLFEFRCATSSSHAIGRRYKTLKKLRLWLRVSTTIITTQKLFILLAKRRAYSISFVFR